MDTRKHTMERPKTQKNAETPAPTTMVLRGRISHPIGIPAQEAALALR